jgi:predicted NBD/HSP70 family sugar kinase
VIGIRIIGDARFGRQRIVGVVTDVLGKVKVPYRRLPLDQLNETYVFAQILNLIAELSSGMNDDDELIGIGMEIGGHVSQGMVVRSANIHWDDFPLARHLSEHVGVPVVLENDANALAIYEQAQGMNSANFAVVLLTYLGVGCGLVLDGRLHRGSRGLAAEMGHIPIAAGQLAVSSDGDAVVDRCRCGNSACLEAIATPHAIELRLKAGGYTGSYEDALEEGYDALVRDVFTSAGVALGQGIVTMLNLLNPDTVILHGPMDLLGPPREFHIDNFETVTDAKEVAGVSRIYTGAMVEGIRAHTFSNAAKGCQFIVKIRDDEHGAMAAAACAIRAIRDRSTVRVQHVASTSTPG